jgi:hypothetical protein
MLSEIKSSGWVYVGLVLWIPQGSEYLASSKSRQRILANSDSIVANTKVIAILLELLLEFGPVNFSKPLPHSRLGLEARVGIAQRSPILSPMPNA